MVLAYMPTCAGKLPGALLLAGMPLWLPLNNLHVLCSSEVA